MNSKSHRRIPQSIAVGDGFCCPETPFSKIVSFDYYDGVIEGIAEIKASDYFVYFKRGLSP
jgi:hypothetical protein